MPAAAAGTAPPVFPARPCLWRLPLTTPAPGPAPAPAPSGRRRPGPGRHRRPPPPSAARRIGSSLALPVAAIPAAGLLLRLGQPDLLGRWRALHTLAVVLSASGGAVLDYLPLLFAAGIGLGMRRGGDPAGPVLACVVAYLMLSRTVLVLDPMPAGQPDNVPARWPYGALAGIIAGLLGVALWRLVERRRVPAFAGYGLVAVTAAGGGWLLGLCYPAVDRGLTWFGASVAGHPVIGGGLFGVLNRSLVPFGLHQIPSSVVWYLTGTCSGGYVGDIPCFLHRDRHAGIFQGGFFAVAMCGLPAAALAMWRSAPPDQRRAAAQILVPAAVMSAVFGVTEPLEFAFVYISGRLLCVHAVLTGLSLAIVNAVGIRDGFVFSAGLSDYILNFHLATRPLWLLPIGAGFAAVYYTVFRFMITRFDLPTPGRGPIRLAGPQGDPR